jgi:hypothetical protein
VTCHSLREKSPAASRNVNSGSPARPGPPNISVARLPVTASQVVGREEDIAFLNDGWANQHVNVVTIVAWAGVGKCTLVNHWLRRLAAEHYRSAELVFGWSFYKQGSSGDTSSADEFLDAALTAVAVPVCFTTHFMKFTAHGSNAGTLPLPQKSSGPAERCSQF